MNITRPLGFESANAPTKGRQQDVGNDEELLQQRHMPVRRRERHQQRDCGEQQGVVRQGRKKLGGQDDVETAIHLARFRSVIKLASRFGRSAKWRRLYNMRDAICLPCMPSNRAARERILAPNPMTITLPAALYTLRNTFFGCHK
jgi:hypothetical protein